MMRACENKGQNYLFKLRRSAGVQKLAQRLFLEADWKAAGDGWSAAQAPLKLLGVSARQVPMPSLLWLERLLEGVTNSHAATLVRRSKRSNNYP